MSDIVEQARERAISYRECGPSAEHTAAMLDELASYVERLRADLAAMRQQRDEAQRDAERYRWLKSDRCYWVEIKSQPHGDLVFQGRYGRAFYHHRGTAEMDDVIDSCIAAMRKGKA